MRNRDMPAKPIFNDFGITSSAENAAVEGCASGLTKLENAAIKIAAALIVNGSGISDYANDTKEYVVKNALSFANALFDELEKAND